MSKEDFDLTTANDVVELMKASASETEWNKNCDKVKAANNNNYPEFWFEKIIMTGVISEVKKGWNIS